MPGNVPDYRGFKMITVRNEFEEVPAFEHIAGCSLGTWTNRETTNEMLSVLDTVQYKVDVNALYKVLACIPDDNAEFMFELQYVTIWDMV